MCNLLTNRKWASDEVEAVATWLCVCEYEEEDEGEGGWRGEADKHTFICGTPKED